MTDYLEHATDFSNPDTASMVDELSFWSSRFGQVLFENIEIRKNLKILDVGCATGFPLFELAHVFGETCHVTGIDIWQQGISRAGTKLRIYNLRNVKVIEADAAQQPFPDGEFDMIVSNLGINNWADPHAVLTECFRIAKPEAKIFLTTNVVGHYKEFYEVFRDTLLALNRQANIERLDVQNAHRGTRESHSKALEQAGWKVIKYIESEFQMRFADGRALFNHSLIKLGFLDGWKSVVDPVKQKDVFSRIENQLNQIAEREGELRMTVQMLYLEGQKKS